MRVFSARCCMSAFLAALCLWPALGASAAPPPRKKVKPMERHGRDTQVIDGAWQTAAANGAVQADGWERDIPPGATDITVPSLTPPPANADADKSEAGTTAWYWRRFDGRAEWKGQTVRLRFEAVAETAQVWLNGQKLGEHQGGATPFEFVVTPALHVGASNLLALRVTGGKWGRGLWQGVMLMAHDEAYLGDCFPQTDALGHVNAVLDFLNSSIHEGDSTLDAQIVTPSQTTPSQAPGSKETARVVVKTNQNLHVTPGLNSTTVLMTVGGKQRLLWSPAAPALYLLQLIFRQDKDLLDTEQVTFGLREWGWQGGAITLNNAPLTLRSLDRPATLPVIASVSDEERLRAALRRVKTDFQAGSKDRGDLLLYFNAPPPVLLRLADEEGILIVEGARTRQTVQAANEELRGLVLRDRAHACILGWRLDSGDADAANALRSLDATRFLLVGVGAEMKLWPPNQNAPAPEALPSGLRPVQWSDR